MESTSLLYSMCCVSKMIYSSLRIDHPKFSFFKKKKKKKKVLQVGIVDVQALYEYGSRRTGMARKKFKWPTQDSGEWAWVDKLRDSDVSRVKCCLGVVYC
jgi:hypothetical protein